MNSYEPSIAISHCSIFTLLCTSFLFPHIGQPLIESAHNTTSSRVPTHWNSLSKLQPLLLHQKSQQMHWISNSQSTRYRGFETLLECDLLLRHHPQLSGRRVWQKQTRKVRGAQSIPQELTSKSPVVDVYVKRCVLCSTPRSGPLGGATWVSRPNATKVYLRLKGKSNCHLVPRRLPCGKLFLPCVVNVCSRRPSVGACDHPPRTTILSSNWGSFSQGRLRYVSLLIGKLFRFPRATGLNTESELEGKCFVKFSIRSVFSHP